MSSVVHTWIVSMFQLHQYIVGYCYDDVNIPEVDRILYLGYWVPVVAVDYFMCTSYHSYLQSIDGDLILRCLDGI